MIIINKCNNENIFYYIISCFQGLYPNKLPLALKHKHMLSLCLSKTFSRYSLGEGIFQVCTEVIFSIVTSKDEKIMKHRQYFREIYVLVKFQVLDVSKVTYGIEISNHQFFNYLSDIWHKTIELPIFQLFIKIFDNL